MEQNSLLVSILPLVIVIVLSWASIRAIKNTAAKYPPVSSNPDSISGVGGWLAFLIFSLMFLGPLINAGGTTSSFLSSEQQFPYLKTNAAWDVYKSVTWWGFLLTSFISIYAGYSLLRVRNIFVIKRTKIILWLIGPVATLMQGWLLPFLVFRKLELGSHFISTIIASFIAATIWVAYLSKSKRVKATYGKINE